MAIDADSDMVADLRDGRSTGSARTDDDEAGTRGDSGSVWTVARRSVRVVIDAADQRSPGRA